jgi:hypothetical protein
VFVTKDLSLRPPVTPATSSSSADPEESSDVPEGESSSSDSSGAAETDPGEIEDIEDCLVDPYRALVAVASLEDMLYCPKGSTELGALYRASSVSLLFKSKEALEQTLEEIIADLRVLQVLLRIPVITFETKNLSDDNDSVDDDSVFWMPGD